VLDLDYAENGAADTDMNVVMTGSGGIVELRPLRRKSLSREALDQLIDLAAPGTSDHGRAVEGDRVCSS
jgi:ribonuclease PH